MKTSGRASNWRAGLAAAIVLSGATAASAAPYPAMAPRDDYRIADREAEIALARTAAPASLSAAAEVLTLGPRGYVTAAPGTNGFVCLVQRAWFSGLEDDGFWNPKLRAPICFNPEAARSVLPMFLARTVWAMAGATRSQILARTRAAMAAGQILAPEVGALTFMMSRRGYLGDGPRGPWRPHLMVYMPPMRTADWGADLAGTGVFATEAGVNPYALFYIPVAAWSDGTPDASAASARAR